LSSIDEKDEIDVSDVNDGNDHCRLIAFVNLFGRAGEFSVKE
jgi:hypothetical protein